MAAPCSAECGVVERGCDPLLDLILQKYIQASRDSIRGPVALKTDVKYVPSHIHEKLGYNKNEPIFEESRLRTTNLDGHTVYGFNVGGEKRICFSELVQTILKDINVHEIFKKRDNLLIFTSKCSQKQMDELKYRGVLPWTATSSNLITKSDAYRLCGALQGHLSLKADLNKRSPLSFDVYHECFGGCIGVFDPELYLETSSSCIRCTECNGLFTTRKFVSHNHTSFDEVHTCHWGFDSSRWRCYIMLVEQKASAELLKFWINLKSKFDSTQQKVQYTTVEQNKDADFVAYIHSPDHKKAMVSPIESLRNQEAHIESVAKYENHNKDSASAFRPWSSNLPRSLASQRGEQPRVQSHHFLFPTKTETNNNRHTLHNGHRLYAGGHSHANNSCSCCPTAPLYMECQQCKKAAHAGCNTSLHMLAQKASERPGEDIKPNFESRDSHNSCSCDQCKHQLYQNKDNLENSIKNVIENFTSNDNKLTTSKRDLTHILCSEIKRLHISQDEKIRDVSVGNQRLQTELQLVKMESSKKLNDTIDTKVQVEQELESLHRERQKEMSMFTKMQGQLHQSMIDCENLKKQLDYYVSQRRSATDKWTPYPTMARQFSDSDENDENIHTSKPAIIQTTHTKPWINNYSAVSQENIKRDQSELSPVNKLRKLEKQSLCKDEESSDIEVED